MKASNEEPPCPNDVVESSTTHNCDVSSSVLDPDQDYLEMHRLPVIRDAIERTSSYSSRFPSAETSAFSGTVRKMDLSKPDPAPERTEPLDTSEKLPLNAQVLQASSVNSAPQLSLGRASSAPVSLMEKENVSHAHKIKRSVHETSSPTKPSKRSKVGGRNRNLVTGAIRSFFR